MKGFVLYDHAIDRQSGKIINIDQLSRKSQLPGDLVCPFCKENMIPILGEVREHHFRHLGTHCSPNRYLHALAIETFLAEFERCVSIGMPFWLLYNEKWPNELSCNEECLFESKGICVKRMQEYRIKVDLASIYSEAIREERIAVDRNGKYRIPDVRLVSSYEGVPDLWIEVFVTHEVDEEKSRQAPIVEIKITNEEDVKRFATHSIGDKNPLIRLYNITKELFPKDYVTSETIPFNTKTCSDWHWRPSKNTRSLREGKTPSLPPLSVTKDSVTKDIWNRLVHTPESSGPSSGLSAGEEKNCHSSDGKNERKSESRRSPSFVPEVTWVDLGLPSGTLWAQFDTNNPMGFHGAMGYRKSLPNEKQVLELKEHCSVSLETVNGQERIAVSSGKGKIYFSKNDVDPGFWMNGVAYDGCAPCYRFLFSKMIRVLDADSFKHLNIHLVNNKTL